MNPPVPATPATSRLTVSVALATYNGERFLGEQLASIAAQTRLPDELVVRDDGSSDGTARLVESFAAQAPFPVDFARRVDPLGAADNFLDAAAHCRSDLVAFCDQDDLWCPGKLAVCVAEFEADPCVVMVVHSATLFGPGAGRGRRRYPAHRRRVVAPPARLPVLPAVPGFATVVHRRVLELWRDGDRASPAWGADVGHDTIVAFWASAVGRTVLLPDDLARYRQHGGNVWGAPQAGLAARARRSASWRGREAETLRRSASRDAARADLLEERLRPPGRYPQARDRAALWRRRGEVTARRAAIYEAPTRGSALRSLVVNLVRGDYGPRRRGGAGLSLGRDALHATGLLGLVTSGGGTGPGDRPPRDG